MEKIEVKLSLRPVNSIREFQRLESGTYIRNIGLLYFQVLENGGMVARVVSTKTNGKWLAKMVRQGRIYVPEDEVVGEDG